MRFAQWAAWRSSASARDRKIGRRCSSACSASDRYSAAPPSSSAHISRYLATSASSVEPRFAIRKTLPPCPHLVVPHLPETKTFGRAEPAAVAPVLRAQE